MRRRPLIPVLIRRAAPREAPPPRPPRRVRRRLRPVAEALAALIPIPGR